MRKTILTLSILTMLFLSACAGGTTAIQSAEIPTVPAAENLVKNAPDQAAASGAATSQDSPSAAAPAVTSTSAETQATATDSLSELQLLLGALKLNGSENAITTEQAFTLLPLLSQLKSLSPTRGPGGLNKAATPESDATPVSAASQAQASGTDEQVQLTELLTQIQAVLTPAQIQAISALDITQENVMTLIQELGITLGGPQSGGGSGGNGAGGGPGGGGQPPQGEAPQGGQQPPQGTPPAGDSAPVMGDNAGSLLGSMVPPGLIDAVIQLLQTTSGATS